MLFRRFIFIRRLTALLLALCLGPSMGEALIADVHDGDATHEELVRVDGAEEHSALHIAHGDAAEVAVIGTQSDASHAHPGERAPGQSGHEQHACHCAHTHGGWPKATPVLAESAAVSHAPPIDFGDRALLSREREPQLRPPIT